MQIWMATIKGSVPQGQFTKHQLESLHLHSNSFLGRYNQHLLSWDRDTRLRDSVICLKTDTTFHGHSLRPCCIQGGHCDSWTHSQKGDHLKGHDRHLVTPGHSPSPHSHVVADRTQMCTNHHTLQPHPLWPTEKCSLPCPMFCWSVLSIPSPKSLLDLGDIQWQIQALLFPTTQHSEST